MLMQIAEPGQSTDQGGLQAPRRRDRPRHDEQPRRARRGRAPAVVIGDDPIVPSVVYYGDGGIVVGRAAVGQAVEAPRETLSSVKRLIGRGMKDIASVRAMLPTSSSATTAR